MLSLLENVIKYLSSKGAFVSAEAETTILGLKETVAKALAALCKSQESTEAEVAASHQEQRAQDVLLHAFDQAIISLERAPTSTDCIDLVNATFLELAFEQQKQILQSLETVLKTTPGKMPGNRNNLPPTYLRLKFTEWTGTLEEKKRAVQQILPLLTTTTSIEQKAVEMRRRLDAALNLDTDSQITSTSTTTSTTTLASNLFHGSAPPQQLGLGNNQISELPVGVFNGLVQPQQLNLVGLQPLNLDDDQLSELPVGVFDGLAGLQQLNFVGLQPLNLDDNQLSELPIRVSGL